MPFYTLEGGCVYHTDLACHHISGHVLPSGRPAPTLKCFQTKAALDEAFLGRRVCKRKLCSATTPTLSASRNVLLASAAARATAEPRPARDTPSAPGTPPAPSRSDSSGTAALRRLVLPTDEVAEREPAVSPTPVERSPAEDPKLEELRREAILLDVVADFDVVNYSAEELRVRIERAEDSVEHEECGDLVAVGDDSDDSFSVLADSIGLELSRLDIPQLPPAAMKDKIEYLGKGAFEVYLYTADLSSLGGSSDARVAAKFLPLLEEATDSIVAEARASWIAASVSSHVPRMHAVVVCDDDVVILMEHVSGETLKSIIARRTKFFLDDVTALAFASDLTAAVAALHGGSFGGGERLAHRDLKPGNIMIAGDLRVAAATGPRPRVRAMLIDLGEAKIIDGADPHTIRATGTARYMAPEVVEVMTSTGSYNALSADMWSLGIVLLELVAAASKKSREFRGLFVGGSGAEVEKLDAVMEACDVTPAWASLIKACVSSTPENRPTATYVHDKVLEMFGSERDALAIREIEMYLEFRVQDSRTIYSVGRRCRELVDWGRVELMTDYIQRGALVKKFTERQRLAFHEVVDSGEFIYSITTDGGFEQLLLPSVTASTTHVVYLAQHRGSRKGYVGLTNRTLKKRMGEHFARDGTAADRAMTNRDEWRWGVLGVFENTAELDWIENKRKAEAKEQAEQEAAREMQRRAAEASRAQAEAKRQVAAAASSTVAAGSRRSNHLARQSGRYAPPQRDLESEAESAAESDIGTDLESGLGYSDDDDGSAESVLDVVLDAVGMRRMSSRPHR